MVARLAATGRFRNASAPPSAIATRESETMYEVRIKSRPTVRFDTQPEAEAYAGLHADENPEMVDIASGQPAAPGATKEDREDYARKVGF
jgi:hypothetical protein